MAWWWLQRWVALVTRAQGTDDLDVLDKQVVSLNEQGKYAEATEVAKHSLALTEQSPDHPDVGARLNNLAVLYRCQGHYGEAEPTTRSS